jgi:hypothetical protein
LLRRVPVAQRDAADEIDEEEQCQAQERGEEDAGEDLVDALLGAGDVDDPAEAAADDELADDGADDRQSGGDTQAGEDGREGEGEAEFDQGGGQDAPYRRNRSRRAGSVESSPASVLATTGKAETMNADAATVFQPYPIQTTSSGATAMIGTVWKKTAYG